jgi:hypothetical protein
MQATIKTLFKSLLFINEVGSFATKSINASISLVVPCVEASEIYSNTLKNGVMRLHIPD